MTGDKGCVFCGGRPLSLEHVVPRWARDELGIVSPLVTTRDVKDQDTRARDGWVRPGLEVKVRDVCVNCNTGWMAALEGRAAKQLPSFVTSTRIKARVEAEFLAIWATKTILVAALQNRDSPLILSSQYQWFFENQRPFPDSLGWFGAFDFGNPYSFSNSGTRPPGSGAWRATINIGALVLMIWVIPREPPPPRIKSVLPANVRQWLTTLYPRRGQHVWWPPRKIMSRHDLHNVAGIDHDAWEDWMPEKIS